ncbi:MAG: voltage-dependent potassium channel beta subunit [Bermanella sp.]|jgi:voltage-dependent potassium channel beta subunit
MSMQYRRLGKSGLKVSEFSYGSWVTFNKQVGTDSAVEMLACVYDHGVNFFDNAEGYEAGESERVMGEALKRLGWSRDSYCVSSKVFWGGSKPTQRGLSRKHVTDACHAALKRLQVDYLDLYFCHRPDVETPIEETLRTMHDLIQQGKILYWGTSEWSAQQLTEACELARALYLTPPTMEQPQYNLLHRERLEKEYRPMFDHYGMGTTIWSPLASGLLTGKYRDGIPHDSRVNLPGYEWMKERFESEAGQRRIEQAQQLEQLADQAGLSLTHLALLWCLQNPDVSTVILGASKQAQLLDNLAALEHRHKLTPELLAQIDELLGNKPRPDTLF